MLGREIPVVVGGADGISIGILHAQIQSFLCISGLQQNRRGGDVRGKAGFAGVFHQVAEQDRQIRVRKRQIRRQVGLDGEPDAVFGTELPVILKDGVYGETAAQDRAVLGNLLCLVFRQVSPELIQPALFQKGGYGCKMVAGVVAQPDALLHPVRQLPVMLLLDGKLAGELPVFLRERQMERIRLENIPGQCPEKKYHQDLAPVLQKPAAIDGLIDRKQPVPQEKGAVCRIAAQKDTALRLTAQDTQERHRQQITCCQKLDGRGSAGEQPYH